ncbi:ankyrin repeat protein [Nakamurella sp. UYEF19]|uniref:ankyrin repeat domain-containing protein n=1 Tax=Nakamurella sp. UYEF19 TaxID=1756392 RepID=UPI00339255E8
MNPDDDAIPDPRQWSWGSDDDSYTVEITGTLIHWTDQFYDERLGGFQHNGRSQTLEDFRGYGPMAAAAPPEVVAELAAHLGVLDPTWARPVPPEVTRTIQLAGKGDTAALNALRVMGADVDLPDSQGNTPLWWAIARRHDDTALALIDWGADVHRPLRHHRDMLMLAASVSGPPLVRALLSRGVAPLAVETMYGGTALTQAIDRGQSEEVVKLLIDAGADVDHRPADGRTPLWMAERRGRPEIVQALLRAGATPSDSHWAAGNGHVPPVRYAGRAKCPHNGFSHRSSSVHLCVASRVTSAE